ncbi:hypothetical protein GCM10009587_23460 [Microbacterium maritypicum]
MRKRSGEASATDAADRSPLGWMTKESGMTVTLCGAAPRRGRRSPDDSTPVKKPTPVPAVQDRVTIAVEREGSAPKGMGGISRGE